MNARLFVPLLGGVVLVAGAASAARADDFGFGFYYDSGPRYYQPVYCAPAPVVYYPPPVYYAPPRVIYYDYYPAPAYRSTRVYRSVRSYSYAPVARYYGGRDYYYHSPRRSFGGAFHYGSGGRHYGGSFHHYRH